MKFDMYLRRFAVTIRAQDTGETSTSYIVLDKTQLQAAQLCGQSSKELIARAYAAKGYDVLDIGKADKRAVCLDLEALWREREEGEAR